MTHVVVIDNQEIPLDEETAASDHEIRQALRWCYPEVANSTINRRTEGDRELITVIKRAGTKGSAPLESAAATEGRMQSANEIVAASLARVRRELAEAPEDVNPAVRLARELQARVAANDVTLGEIILRRAEMEAAIKAGEAEEARVETAQRRLVRAQPEVSRLVPTGF